MQESLSKLGYWIWKLQKGQRRPRKPEGVHCYECVLTGQMTIADHSVITVDTNAKQDRWVSELGYDYTQEEGDHWQWSVYEPGKPKRHAPGMTEDDATLLVYIYFVPASLPKSGTVMTVGRWGGCHPISMADKGEILELASDERKWHDLEASGTGEEHWARWSPFFITRTSTEPCHNFLGSLAFAQEHMTTSSNGTLKLEGVKHTDIKEAYWPGKKPFLSRLEEIQKTIQKYPEEGGFTATDAGFVDAVCKVSWTRDTLVRCRGSTQPSREFFTYVMSIRIPQRFTKAFQIPTCPQYASAAQLTELLN